MPKVNKSVYEPPKSDLENNEIFKRPIAWKIYFVFYMLISILGFLALFFEPHAGFAEYIGIPIFILEAIGLFGFCFLKPIYKPKFWLFVLIVNVFYSFAYYFISDINLDEGMSERAYYISQVIGFILYLPAFIGLYLYSKITDHAWKSTVKSD